MEYQKEFAAEQQYLDRTLGFIRENLAREEARFIRQAIEACGGDLGKAASRLGISRMTLWRKLHPREGRGEGEEM